MAESERGGRAMNKGVKLKPKDAAALEEFVGKLRAVLSNNLIEVKLFGSKATGRDQPESDIDVFVSVEKGGIEVEDLSTLIARCA